MRVLHVIPSIAPETGGLRTGTLATCLAMKQAGIEPEIVCLHGESDLPTHRFKPGLRVTGASRGMRDWLMQHAGDYDAIIAHVVWLNPAHYAAEAAAKSGVPLYLASRGMLDPDALAHHRLRKLIRWHLGARALARGSILVFSSEADRERSLSHPELADARAIVVPNPVQLPEPAPQAEGAPVVLCLNRLHPRKGVLEWSQALLKLREEGLVFEAVHAGTAEDAAYAERVRKLGACRLLGPCSHDEAVALVAGAAMVVHPSVGFENFGNVIIEGMAAAKPVVASRRALVTPELEAAGVVIGTEPTPEHLADAMRRLLQDSGAREALGAKARAYASEHFCYQAVGQRWREILSH
ncbi:MAG: glycosyltransferase [Planctomycetes bacterium]|nr:glycosyltransferase [Planctomycetota bacterium]